MQCSLGSVLPFVCLFAQDTYSQVEIFRFTESEDRCPKDNVHPFHEELNMVMMSSICNYTKASNVDVKYDQYADTLSAGALQTILEYTTRPGDTVFTLNAQFGAIYEAAENCGRLVFGTECHAHFQNLANQRMIDLVKFSEAAQARRSMSDPQKVVTVVDDPALLVSNLCPFNAKYALA